MSRIIQRRFRDSLPLLNSIEDALDVDCRELDGELRTSCKPIVNRLNTFTRRIWRKRRRGRHSTRHELTIRLRHSVLSQRTTPIGWRGRVPVGEVLRMVALGWEW